MISDARRTAALWTEIEKMMVIRHDFPSLDGEWRPYLGRLWKRVPDGWLTKMKPGYFEDLLASFDLLTCRPVASPSWVDSPKDLEDETCRLL